MTSSQTAFLLPALALLLACGDKDDADDTGGSAGAPDADGDGHDADTDCDDDDPAVNPGATEVCDGVDNNCDGQADEGVLETFYGDSDGDGYGSPDAVVQACEASEGEVAEGTDCNDQDAGVHPGADEVCDPDDVDEDCSGTADDGDANTLPESMTTWYTDVDGDGYGDETDPGAMSCEPPSTDSVADNTDCDDAADTVNPGEIEVCDALDVDEDCSGLADDADAGVDASTMSTWYADTDGDGYGGEFVAAVTACDDPSDASLDYFEESEDCDDDDDSAYPFAHEDCTDEVDNDCDGNVDETCQTAGDAASILTGPNGSDRAGYAVGAGDFDGDGIDDVLVSVHHASEGNEGAGGAYVVLGPLSSGEHDLDDEAVLAVFGDQSGENLGSALELVPDVDGDGYDELVLGARSYDETAGRAAVVYGPATGTMGVAAADLLMTGDSGDEVGEWECGSAGDIDDDGVGDFLFAGEGGNEEAGVAYLFLGAATGVVDADDADITLSGSASGQRLAISRAAGHDLNSDGVDDLVLGADGGLFAFYGPLTADASATDADVQVAGDSAADFGDAVTIGDFDLDGTPDIAVSASGDDTWASNSGAVFLLAGPVSSSTTTADAFATIYGSNGNDAIADRYGQMATADITGDGNDDLVIGARYADPNGAANAGVIYVAMGPLSGTGDADSVAEYVLSGMASSDDLGQALAVGDMDGDGLLDILGGAFGAGGSSEGQAYLFYGVDL